MAKPERFTRERFAPDGFFRPDAVERIGQAAVAEAIGDHKAHGAAIYYRDPSHPGFLVEELADGRRFLLAREYGHPIRVRRISAV